MGNKWVCDPAWTSSATEDLMTESTLKVNYAKLYLGGRCRACEAEGVLLSDLGKLHIAYITAYKYGVKNLSNVGCFNPLRPALKVCNLGRKPPPTKGGIACLMTKVIGKSQKSFWENF